MKFSLVLALIGATEAVKLRSKANTSNKALHKAAAKIKAKRFNPHSAQSIMETFDADGDGTIWQNSEFRPKLEEMCGGKETPCYEEGMEHFFGTRGDVKDGIQLDEIIAYLEKQREQHIDEIMAGFDEHSGNLMTEMDAHMAATDAQMQTLMAEQEAFMKDFDQAHVEYWNQMAQEIVDQICQDDKCKQHAMDVYNHEMEQSGHVGRDEVREFIMFVEGLSEFEPQPLVNCVQDPENHGYSYPEFKDWAEANGGRLPTTQELKDYIGETPFEDGRDIWAATVDADGSSNYVQLSNQPWYPGMDHNEQGWGRPWEQNGGGWMTSVTCVAYD